MHLHNNHTTLPSSKSLIPTKGLNSPAVSQTLWMKNSWVKGSKEGWVDNWMKGWMDGWMDGWIDRWLFVIHRSEV